MSIEIVYANCQKKYQVGDQHAGRTATCKTCGDKIPIPALPQPPDDDDELRLAPLDGLPAKGPARVAAKEPSSQPSHQLHQDPPAVVSPPDEVEVCCPQCNATLKPDAIICVRCGYDQRTGTAHSTPRQQQRAVRRKTKHSMRKVRLGLSLVYWAMLAILLSFVLPVVLLIPYLFMAVMKMGALEMAMYALLFIGILLVLMLSTVANTVGRILCLWAPAESGARVFIYICVALDTLSLVASFASLVATVPAGVRLACSVSGLPSALCFLLFLSRIAGYVGRRDLAGEAKEMILLFVGLLVAIILVGIASFVFIFFPMIPRFLCFGLIVGILMVLMKYVTLLGHIRNAVRDADRPAVKTAYPLTH